MEQVKFVGGDLNGRVVAVRELAPTFGRAVVFENDGAGPYVAMQKSEIYQLKWWENGKGELFPVYQFKPI
jgi:hypothetical protein